MRGNVGLVATCSTIVAITGWLDANQGWPLTQLVLHEALSSDLISSIPSKYANFAAHFGEAILIAQGIVHVVKLWRRGMRLHAGIAFTFLIGAFSIIRPFLDQFMLAGAASMASQQLPLTDIGFWLQVALYAGVPTLLRGTALEVIKGLTPLPQKTTQTAR